LAISIFLSFECVVAKSNVNNLTQALMQALMHQKGFTKKLIGTRFMTFGTDGVSTFQGIRLGVT
jgi:hypothetical protein